MEKKLRSHRWFFGKNETGLLHKGALRSSAIDMDNYTGQPIIGIANTWSELNSCNMSLQEVSLHVKNGIREAGGIPLEFPVISLGEELMKPSAMLYRNLLSIDVEENLRSYPIDGVVLLGNCDKTVPGLMMGAISANLPTIQLNAGPKKAGFYKNQKLGSGTDLWKYWDELRKGQLSDEEWENIGKSLSCGFGSCNTMGTASTMNGLMESLGMMPMGLSALAIDCQLRFDMSKDAGKRIVSMVYEDLKPSDILTTESFKNAIILCMALGGSTNAIIHLTAMAGRLNIPIYPKVFNQAGDSVPCIVNVQPVGKSLMDEFDSAGGIPTVLHQLKNLLDLTVKTYTGKSLASVMSDFNPVPNDLIATLSTPLINAPTIAVLHGNLAPNGAVIKVAAASASLMMHTGGAIVFDNYEEMLDKIDDDALEVNETNILILRNAGPKGVPGMPEWGMIPIPKKLQLLGVTDMIRLSDARMSGTSFGTVVLHITPEAAVGGPLALVKSGDLISLDIKNKILHLHVSEDELNHRKAQWKPPVSKHKRGYPKLYINEVLQADEGCDFNFLKPRSQDDFEFIEPVVGRS